MNLRSARRGAAAGPSGMTVEHLQTLGPPIIATFDVSSRREVGQSGCSSVDRGHNPTRPNGGVRGIVVGDVSRRVEARIVAQQMSPAVEGATAHFQFALSTMAGCECVSHALQALTEADPETTFVSFDGASAFDLITRQRSVAGGAVLPICKTLLRQNFAILVGRCLMHHSCIRERVGSKEIP